MESTTFTQLFGLALKQLADEKELQGHCWLSEQPEQLHTRVKELAEKYSEHLVPLQTLHFATGGAFPYSSELSRSLDLLQQAGMIKRENPSFDHFAPTWTEDTFEVYKERKRRIFEKDKVAEKAFDNFVGDLATLIRETTMR